MLKALCYLLAPLQFGGNHILVIFAQNMHQKLSFSDSKCKNFPAKGGGNLPPRPSPCSSEVRSLGFSNPQKNSGYGPDSIIYLKIGSMPLPSCLATPVE